MLESLLDILLVSGESLILMPVCSFDYGKSNLKVVSLRVPRVVGESELEVLLGGFGKSVDFLPKRWCEPSKSEVLVVGMNSPLIGPGTACISPYLTQDANPAGVDLPLSFLASMPTYFLKPNPNPELTS